MNRLISMINLLRIYRSRFNELRAMKRFPIRQERLIYHCPLTAGKRKNLARQHINRALLGVLETAYPHILHVGVTTHCNLRCPACPTGMASLGRPRQHLDFDIFCRTLDALRDYLLFMLFWDWGEPLLHPRIAEMIAYATKSDIKTVISTNGNIGGSRDRIERLVAARPTNVIVCVDGANQQTYETYRAGGDLKRVLQTIGLLAETKQRLGLDHPLIEFRSLATRFTEHQMPQLLQLALNSGADLFTVKTLRPYDYRGYDVDAVLVPKSAELSRYRYTGQQRGPAQRLDFLSKGPLQCAKPLYAPTLNADGTLAFCSYAQEKSEFFGSLAVDSFATLWKRGSSRDRRRQFLRAGGTPSCGTCFFRSAHNPTILYQVPLGNIPADIGLEAPQTREAFLRAVSPGSGGNSSSSAESKCDDSQSEEAGLLASGD